MISIILFDIYIRHKSKLWTMTTLIKLQWNVWVKIYNQIWCGEFELYTFKVLKSCKQFGMNFLVKYKAFFIFVTKTPALKVNYGYVAGGIKLMVKVGI